MGTGETLYCEGNGCRINYAWTKTPVVAFITTPVVYEGIEAQIIINTKEANAHWNDYQGDPRRIQIRTEGTNNEYGDW